MVEPCWLLAELALQIALSVQGRNKDGWTDGRTSLVLNTVPNASPNAEEPRVPRGVGVINELHHGTL